MMMGTKNRPGKYDCYAKAEPDEPIFVLLARDPLASEVVSFWAWKAVQAGVPEEKIDEALQCSREIIEWRKKHTSPPITSYQRGGLYLMNKREE
jgi:hypothetical protein